MATAVRRLEHNPKAKRLISAQFQSWLDQSVFVLSGGVEYSRRMIAELSESPCTRAATNLDRICREFNIHTVNQLHHVGLASLLRCGGVGERTAWMAALILEDHGYDIDVWIDRPDTGRLSRKTAIRLVHSKVKKQQRGA